MKVSESFDLKPAIEVKKESLSKPETAATITINHSRFRSFEKHNNSTLTDYLSQTLQSNNPRLII